MQTQTSNTLHNAIMEAGGKDHKIVPVSKASSETTTETYMENYKNVLQDIRDQQNSEAEAVQINLIGIDNNIYSTVDACPNACEMWKAIKSFPHCYPLRLLGVTITLYKVADPILSREQQVYLQNEHYALWEVIEFGDSYKVPKDSAATGSTSDGKKGRTVAITTEDMQKRRNDVKERTTLLLALPDEHQLRFSKYKTAQELWAAILKTFGGNEATRKTKKNLLKQQYGNFKAEGKETLEQTFNRLQAIVSQLEFIDVEIESDLDTMSLDDLYNHLKVYEPKVKEQAPKALMAIDEVRWNWSYMENNEENHALVAEEEAPTEFALMAKSSIDNEVFDNSLCSKACKKNTDSLNSQITELSKKLGDTKYMLYHYKLGLSHVEARLVEFKNQEIKFCKKIRGLEFSVECKTNRIENLTNELETLKKEKEGLDSKRTGFKSASKYLDNLLESQRSDKNKERLGYSVVPPPPAQVYSPLKKNMCLTGLPEFADDTITDYTRRSPGVENSPTVVKTDKKETVRKPTIKYAELYRKTSKRSNVRGNQRNWNNLKSQQLRKNFLMKKACYNCGSVDHLSYDCGKWVDQGRS
nr:ribonuclease H-like domain-containing protein [Tanacetum cinerariifolium]